MTKPIRPETPRLGMRFSDHTEGPRQEPKPRPFWYVSGGASCGHRHRTLRAAYHCPYPGEIKEGREALIRTPAGLAGRVNEAEILRPFPSGR